MIYGMPEFSLNFFNAFSFKADSAIYSGNATHKNIIISAEGYGCRKSLVSK